MFPAAPFVDFYLPLTIFAHICVPISTIVLWHKLGYILDTWHSRCASDKRTEITRANDVQNMLGSYGKSNTFFAMKELPLAKL